MRSKRLCRCLFEMVYMPYKLAYDLCERKRTKKSEKDNKLIVKENGIMKERFES